MYFNIFMHYKKIYIPYFLYFLLAANYSAEFILKMGQSGYTLIIDEYYISILILPFYFLFFRIVTNSYYSKTAQIRMNPSRKIILASYYSLFASIFYSFLYILAAICILAVKKQTYFSFEFTYIGTIINQQIIMFIICFLFLILLKNQISLILCLSMSIIPIIDYFFFSSKLIYFFNIAGLNAFSPLYFFRNIAVCILIFLNTFSFINRKIVEREILIRWKTVKKMVLMFILILLYTFFKYINYQDYSYLSVYSMEFLLGVEPAMVKDLLYEDIFSFPFMWYFIIVLYFLFLGSTRYEDWTSTGVYLRIRTTKHTFSILKNLSLLCISFFFVTVYFFIPLILDTQFNPNANSEIDYFLAKILLTSWMVLYSSGIFYEYMTMKISPKISLVIVMILIFVNILFGKGIYLNALMVNQWELVFISRNLAITWSIIVFLISCSHFFMRGSSK